MEKERDYNKSHCGIGPKFFGLPPPVQEKKLVSLSGYVKNDINHYLLECSNCLSSVSLLPTLINDALAIVVSGERRERGRGREEGEEGRGGRGGKVGGGKGRGRED